jgi:methylase of polypeptide subunit release factors
MKTGAPGPFPERFEGAGVVIDFDRTQCLPPDLAGVGIGFEAASVINTMRRTAGEPMMPAQALELGIGSGVSMVAMLHRVDRTEGVSVTGMDIDEAAVATTRHNLEKQGRNGTPADTDIFVGDWYDEAVWQRLGPRNYDVIMCNPPYLAEGTPLMEGYETVPRTALYAEGDGMEHHRFLLPRLLGVLSVREGATIIMRFHSTIRGQHSASRAVDEIIEEAVTGAPARSDLAIVRRILAPVGPGRNMSTVTISRSDSALPPHLTPVAA